MAAHSSSSSTHSRPPPTTLYVITIILSVLALTFRSTSSLTFNFTNFATAGQNLSSADGKDYNNSATIDVRGALILTNNNLYKTGRVTYNDFFHLWDEDSGSLADFSTHFSFVIDSNGSELHSDGMAFFLAPPWFPVPDNQLGSGLGLVSGAGLYTTTYPFVALEFDTFENSEFRDMRGDHVGIDVNLMESVAGVNWKSGVLDGKLCEAWINYDAVSKELSVVFTGFDENETVLQSFNHTIDLRKILPEYVCLGFGAATGAYSELHSIRSWWFDSKLVVLINETSNAAPPPTEVIGSPKPIPGSPTPIPGSPKPIPGRNRTGLISGSVSAGAIFVLIVLVGFIIWRKRGRDKELRLGMDEEFENETGPKRYSYKALQRATGKFDEKNKLGEGGFGEVYKGFTDGRTVAIKRVSKGSKQGVKEYASEVRVISKLRHRNLVQLLGWCHERDEMLLVYEFMPNGSLDTHLFEFEIALTWALRFKIAQGVAAALLYLHEGCDQYVVHRDIKSSNVILDSAFNAKLGDFGLARLVDHQKISQTTDIAGTCGYIDPESITNGKITKQSDIYSFGVLLLEIASGRKPIDLQAPENKVSLVDWVDDLYHEGQLVNAADSRLDNDYNKAELQCLLTVGLWCAQPTQVSRPTIRQASLVLNFEAPSPTLPDRVPNSVSYLHGHSARLNYGHTFNESYTELSIGTTSYSINSGV
ncbi:unnamed protein product [Rhodiola kirilowii]